MKVIKYRGEVLPKYVPGLSITDERHGARLCLILIL